MRWGAALLAFLVLAAVPDALARSAQAPVHPPVLDTVSRQTPGLLPATLYFRYRDTAFLGQEERTVSVSPPGSYALALVRALAEETGPLEPYLSPLFPPRTQVLSVQQEGGVVFVTFNEALMASYPDESAIRLALPEYRRGEGQLRRRLAMASLVNTLTENLDCSDVQVLVRAETYIGTSMRLSSRYYLQDSDTLPDPLRRDEAYLLTPWSAARRTLDAAAGQGWQAAAALCAGSPGPEAAFGDAQRPALLSFALSPGSVSPDGQRAIVCVDYELLSESGSASVRAYPLRLLRGEGIWLVSGESLAGMAEALP